MEDVKTIDQIKQEVRIELEADYTKKFENEVSQLEAANKANLTKVIDDWKASQTPPTTEEIKILLGQEYYEFPIKLTTSTGLRDFTIRELPQSVEKKFYKNIKSKLLPKIKELTGISTMLAELNTDQIESKITGILELFEPTFDILADTVALILNPFNEDDKSDITMEWVQNNISSFRQYNIILAQERANRLRDFFLHVSRASLGETMIGVGSRS